VEKRVYRTWDSVPATLATKTQLAAEGLRPRGLPAKDQPVVAYKTGMRRGTWPSVGGAPRGRSVTNDGHCPKKLLICGI